MVDPTKSVVFVAVNVADHEMMVLVVRTVWLSVA